jgi:hypothetical protein
MFVVDLECSTGHAFEGWYDTSKEYEALADAGDVTCPLCGSSDVTRHLSTGGFLSTRRSPEPKPQPPVAPAAVPLEVQKAMAAVVQWVKKTHVDVGDGFAKTARAIHEGEEPARPIYGRATVDEERTLADLGIAFGKIPIPDIEQN